MRPSPFSCSRLGRARLQCGRCIARGHPCAPSVQPSCVLFALPLVFMLSGSLRPPGLPPPPSPQLVPDPLGLGSYGRAFELVDLGRYTLNSLLVAALVVPLTVLVASWAGFALARLARPLARRSSSRSRSRR